MNRTVLIILVCTAVLSSGCWGRREIDDLALIDAIGIDVHSDGFLLTAEVSNTAGAAMTNQQGGVQAKPLVISVPGRTLFEATRKLMEFLSRRPFFGNIRIMVIGEELARQGLIPALDYVGRDDEMRRSVQLLIARGTTAREILLTDHPIDSMTGVAIDRTIRWRLLSSSSPSIDLSQFLRTVSAEGVQNTAGVVELVPPQELEMVSVPIRLSGGAVFSEDRLIGYLDGDEARGLLLARGELSDGVLIVEEQGGRYISFRIIRQRSRITPTWDGQTPVIDIHISAEASVIQQTTDLNTLDPDHVREIEHILAEGIQREIRGVIAVAQTRFNSDIFGFGQSFFRRYPRQWRDQLQPNWSDIFPELEIRITVQAVVRRSGLRSRPVPTDST